MFKMRPTLARIDADIASPGRLGHLMRVDDGVPRGPGG
jgi:hypothetical protein